MAIDLSAPSASKEMRVRERPPGRIAGGLALGLLLGMLAGWVAGLLRAPRPAGPR